MSRSRRRATDPMRPHPTAPAPLQRRHPPHSTWDEPEPGAAGRPAPADVTPETGLATNPRSMERRHQRPKTRCSMGPRRATSVRSRSAVTRRPERRHLPRRRSRRRWNYSGERVEALIDERPKSLPLAAPANHRILTARPARFSRQPRVSPVAAMGEWSTRRHRRDISRDGRPDGPSPETSGRTDRRLRLT